MKRWQKITIAVSLTMLVLVMAGWWATYVAVAEFYESGRHSTSSAEAEARGILVARPAVAAGALSLAGSRYRVADAWIERESRIEYRFFLFRREIPTRRSRLVVRTEPLPGDSTSTLAPISGTERFTYNDGRSLSPSGDIWLAPVAPPFPDTVRLASRPW